jgi:hypothetical protein
LTALFTGGSLCREDCVDTKLPRGSCWRAWVQAQIRAWHLCDSWSLLFSGNELLRKNHQLVQLPLWPKRSLVEVLGTSAPGSSRLATLDSGRDAGLCVSCLVSTLLSFLPL